MSLTIRDVAGVATALTVLAYLPDEEDLLRQSHEHYLVGKYARHALPANQYLMQFASSEPKGWLDITWPLKKIVGNVFTLVNYAIDKPLIATGLLIEKAVRGDFNSTISQAEENLKALKIQNEMYDEELQKFGLTADLLVRIKDAVEKKTEGLALENFKNAEKIERKSQQVEGMVKTLQALAIEDVMEALEAITADATIALNDQNFVEDLKIDVERIERVDKQLGEATASLHRAKERFEKQICLFRQMMNEAHDLGIQKEKVFKEIEKKAAALVEKAEPEHSILYPEALPYDNSN